MLIATWNVNSIRTRLPQVIEWIKSVKPDLLCLQETKVEDKDFPLEQFDSCGYHIYFHGQKAYNGVALVSRHPIEDVRFGFSGELKLDSKTNYLEDPLFFMESIPSRETRWLLKKY